MSTVNTKALAAAVRQVGLAVPKRPSVPILSTVVVSGTPDSLTLSAFDYEASVTVTLPVEAGFDFDPVLVEHKWLVSALKGMTKRVNDRTEFGFAEGIFLLSQGGFSTTTKPEWRFVDYPSLPKVEGEFFRIATDALKQVAADALVTAGNDLMLPVLTGAHVRVAGTELVAESTDRFRLGESRATVSGFKGEAEFLVPARFLAKVAEALPEGVATVRFDVANSFLSVEADGVFATTRLLDGDFPRVKQIWPTDEEFWFEVAADGLVAALAPASGSTIVVSGFEGEIRVEDENGATFRVPAKTSGRFATGFNPKFLAEITKAHKGESIRVTAASEVKPWVFRGERDARRYLLMPRRIEAVSAA